MRKLERLAQIERTWGSEFVLPYFVCRNIEEIAAAARRILALGNEGWGMRTDWRDGAEQGFDLPFLFAPTLDEAGRVVAAYGSRLVYIVSANILQVLLHGVGILADPEHVFFEINDRETRIAQRHMYRNPENLRQFVVGHAGYSMWNETIWRSFESEDVHFLGLDVVWRKMVELQAPEVTFTVLPGHKVVVW